MLEGFLRHEIPFQGPTADDQSLHPSPSEANRHKVTQRHSQTEAVAVAERATISTSLQPDVNNGDRLFGKHAAG